MKRIGVVLSNKQNNNQFFWDKFLSVHKSDPKDVNLIMKTSVSLKNNLTMSNFIYF